METKERKIGVVTEVICIPKGAENPCAIKIARLVDENYVEDKEPRPYPPRSPFFKFKVGDLISLTDDGNIDDALSYMEQDTNFSGIKKIYKEMLLNLKVAYGIDLKSDVEKFTRIVSAIEDTIEKNHLIKGKDKTEMKNEKGRSI